MRGLHAPPFSGATGRTELTITRPAPTRGALCPAGTESRLNDPRGLLYTARMKHLLLVYSSQSGHTEALAQAVAAGAAESADDVELRCLRADAAGLEDLLWANGLLIGTPENFGYLSGLVKDFLDRTYYPAQSKVTGLPWAMFVSADNDGSGAVRALERIALGYGWSKVAEPVISHGVPDAEALRQCRELGQAMAAGLGCGIF